MNRRKFLKSVLGTGVAAAGTGSLGSMLGMSSAFADHVAGAVAPPTVVVVFQRGGCDGLNTVVPYGDSFYPGLRPTIRIANPGQANGALPINDVARGHDGFFGLNPNMSSLLPIFNAGDLAVMPAVHYPRNSHSHFSGQDFIESGSPNDTTNGWLYRSLDAQSKLGGLQGISFGSRLSRSFRGDAAVQSITNIANFGFPSSGIITRLRANVESIYNTTATNSSEALVHSSGQVMFSNITALNAIDTTTYVPSNGATYPANTYGRQMREAAQLIRSSIPVELITVSIGGYDTHSNQGNGAAAGRHSTRIREFSEGIAGLYNDLGPLMDNVIILTMTEFGRTAKENGSNGTDHGDASSWFMVGKQIQGGIHGTWPGLDPVNDLVRGRYLNRSIDYRDIYGDILINHLGHTPTAVAGMFQSTVSDPYSYNTLNLFA